MPNKVKDDTSIDLTVSLKKRVLLDTQCNDRVLISWRDRETYEVAASEQGRDSSAIYFVSK